MATTEAGACEGGRPSFFRQAVVDATKEVARMDAENRWHQAVNAQWVEKYQDRKQQQAAVEEAAEVLPLCAALFSFHLMLL